MTDNDNELRAILKNYPRLPHEQQELIQALNRWRDAAVLEQMYEVNQMAITADVPEIYRVAITRRIQAIKARNGGDDE